jgi:glycerol-3-phosphate acyltransferase PlsY
MGRRRAALVVVGDILKGAAPVFLARWLSGGDPALEAACGVAAVVGSARSIFLGFHGGRGVATGVGTMLVIQPLAVAIATPVFVLVILATRYVSLGSLIGSAAMVPAVALVFLVLNGTVPAAYLLYAVVGAAIVWIAHADNIERLLHGTERKFDLSLLSGRSGSGGAS